MQKIGQGIVGAKKIGSKSPKVWLIIVEDKNFRPKRQKSQQCIVRGKFFQTRVCEYFVKHGKKATQNAKKFKKE